MNYIHIGDCIETMRAWAGMGVRAQMCVTSPPYFGLRDYGHAGQIGLEETPEQFITKLVEVFREVRRVLRDDGTAWVNMGDSYCSTDKWGGGGNIGKNTVADDGSVPSWQVRNKRAAMRGFKPKDLLGIPWRLAMALQQDGAADWKAVEVLDRVMRELVTPFHDAGEDVPDFVLNTYERLAREWREAKGESWYLRQDIVWSKPNPMPESVQDRCTKSHEYIFLLSKSPRYYCDMEAIKEPAVGGTAGNKGPTKGGRAYINGVNEHRTSANLHAVGARETRNKRSVWTVATRPYKGAHFATFPPDLIEPCVLAGSRPGDVVLDPFMGSGTTAAVAVKHGRQYLGCELNPEYEQLQQQRLVA